MIKNISCVVIGTFLLTVSVQFFILPYHILSGGVAGLAVAFNPFFHINETLFANVLVVVLFVIGSWALGKDFAINTMVSSYYIRCLIVCCHRYLYLLKYQ